MAPSTPVTGAKHSLWPPLLLSGMGYVALALWFPLRPNLAYTDAADIISLAPTLGDGLAYAALLVLLFLLLIVIVRNVWLRGLPIAGQQHRAWQQLAVILGVAGGLGLPLVLMYPINATDVFRYGLQGHVSATYDGNPYIEPLDTYAADPLLAYAGEWSFETTPYGPVWEIAAALLARSAPAGMLGTLVTFKAFGLTLLLATSAVLWVLLAGLPAGHRAAYTVLWAWNPALLLTFVANGHNDGLMLFWLLVGMLLIMRGRPLPGLAAAVVAVLTKPIALLVLPVFVISELHRQSSLAARVRLVVLTGLASVFLTGLAFLPWAGEGGWAAAPTALVSRLAREAGDGAGFSPTAFIYFALQAMGLSVSIATIGNIFLALFLLLYVMILWQTWRGKGIAFSSAETFAGYLLQALNFRIWYAAWPFPFLIADGAERDAVASEPMYYWLRAGFWFLLTTQLSVVIYGHVRLFVLGGSQPLAHFIAVPLTFLLPLLLARWTWLPSGQPSREQDYVSGASDSTW